MYGAGPSNRSSEELAFALSKRDLLKETMRESYIHLMEMDELVREKLFILQVNGTLIIK